MDEDIRYDSIEEDKKYRKFVFTLNNYTEEDIIHIKNLSYRYVIFGKEIAPSTGTPHLQGGITWSNPISWKSMKKKIPRCWCEPMKSFDGTVKYCKKSDLNFFEDGEPDRQGKRTDIQEVKDMLKQGCNLRQVVEKTESYQSIRHAEIHLKYFEKPRKHKPFVVWCHGATGTGKSRFAYEQCEGHDTYTAMSTGRWFEGYDRHTHVIIDDMRKDFMKFHDLLRLLDRYEMRIECKGGSRQFVATHIFITSCYSPSELFETREDVRQLIRRIDEIKMFVDNKYGLCQEES